MALFKINGVEIATPATYVWNIMDISKSERNAAGSIIIERITTKRKLELSWNFLLATQLQTLLTQISGVFFTIIYVDAQTNTNKTGTFYVGDRSVGMQDYQSNVARYKDIKFNFIEK